MTPWEDTPAPVGTSRRTTLDSPVGVRCARYTARYHNGYWRVIDTETGAVVPPDPGNYSRYEDGYLWDYAAGSAAYALNAAAIA